MWQFMQQGCLGGTMQSWSYGMFRLNVTAPAGLASGGAYAMAVKPDWSTALWLHGSLIFLYGDLSSTQSKEAGPLFLEPRESMMASLNVSVAGTGPSGAVGGGETP